MIPMTPMRSQQRRLRYLEALGAARRRVMACWTPCGLLLLALIVAGCGTTITDSPGGARPLATASNVEQGSQTDQAVAPVILRNPAPGTLDVSLAVTFDQQIGDSQPMIEVGLAFLSGDHPVQFAGDERVTCDGAALSLKNRAAVFQVLRTPAEQVAGTTVRCTYAASGAVASVALQIPSAPAITSPTMGAKVARSVRTPVSYRYDPATSTIMGIVALAPSSPTPKVIGRLNTPGLGQATLDTSGFSPGPGSLALTLSLTPQIAVSGVPFRSASTFGTALARVDVTWI